jgi:hypothetical protein
MIKMYWNDEKIDMILVYGECDKNACAVGVYSENNHFPKNSSFFHNFILPSE